MATAVKHARVRARKKKGGGKAAHTGGVRGMRLRYGLPQGLLGRLLDVSLRTVSGLETGGIERAQAGRNLMQVERLCAALAEVMDAGYVGRWLDTPNEMLGGGAGLKPVEAIERGQLDLVWQVVEGLRSGGQL